MNLSTQALIHFGVWIVIAGVLFYLLDILVLRKIGDPVRTVVCVLAGLGLVLAILRFFGMW